MKKTALILGGTGLVGSHTIKQLVANPDYDQIIVLTRNYVGYDDLKIHEVVTNFKDYSFIEHLSKIDSIFSCLGTTKQLTPNNDDYLAIEIGIPKNCLDELAKVNNLPQKIHVVSAIGANSSSKNFYMKMKGQLEELISNYPIDGIYFYQPAVILGERKRSDRWWEKLAVVVSKGFDKVLKGESMKYHTIEASAIASAMIKEDNNKSSKKITRLLYTDMVN